MNQFVVLWQHMRDYLMSQPAGKQEELKASLKGSNFPLDQLLYYRMSQPYLTGDDGYQFHGPVSPSVELLINMLIRQLEHCIHGPDLHWKEVVWSLYLMSKLKLMSENHLRSVSVDHHRYLLSLVGSLIKQQAERFRLAILEVRNRDRLQMDLDEYGDLSANKLTFKEIQLLQSLVASLARTQFPPHLIAQLGRHLEQLQEQFDSVTPKDIREIEHSLKQDWKDFCALVESLKQLGTDGRSILTNLNDQTV